jgi:hypothetical protein
MFLCKWRVRYANDRAKAVLGWQPEVKKEEVKKEEGLPAKVEKLEVKEEKVSGKKK